MFSKSQWPWPSKQNFYLIKFYSWVKVGVCVIFVDISSKCSENTAPIFSKQLGFPLLPQCLRSVNKPRHELQVQSPKLKPDESQQIYCPLKLCVTDKGLTQTLICDCTLQLFFTSQLGPGLCGRSIMCKQAITHQPTCKRYQIKFFAEHPHAWAIITLKEPNREVIDCSKHSHLF